MPDEDAQAAADTVAALLETPTLQAAVRARRVLGECPFVLLCEDGSLIAGKIDLAFLDNSGWTIVDYKTGRADRREYEHQIEVYALAWPPIECL